MLLVALCIWSMSICESTMAQAPTGANPNWQFGSELFHLLLEQKGLETTTDIDAAWTDNPKRTVIVLLGENPSVSFSRIRTFLNRGGALLIATDRGFSIPGFCRLARGSVSVSEESSYKGYTDCPLVTSIAASHPIASNVQSLVANRSGYIDSLSLTMGSTWKHVAALPDGSRWRRRNVSGRQLASTILPGRNQGRAIVIGDHSFFINGMLWHGDNAVFVLNIANWLTPRSLRKKQLLYVVDGVPQTSGLPDSNQSPPNIPPDQLPNIPADQMPEIDPDQLPEELPDVDLSQVPENTLGSWGRFSNEFLTAAEDADLFNELAADRPRDMADRMYRRNLLLLLAIIGILFLIYQLAISGQRVDRPTGRPSTNVNDPIAQAARVGDYQPACRELSRSMFRRLTGADEPAGWVMRESEIQIEGEPWFQRSMRLRIKRLEKIARNLNRQRVSKRQFVNLASEIDEIHELYEKGRISHPRIVPNA